MDFAKDRAALTRKLRDANVPRSYAWQLANGKRSPSLALAKRLEADTGIPATSWPMPEAVQ